MKKKYLYAAAALVVLAVIFFAFRMTRSTEKTISFETAKVGRGTISNTVTATGTLEAIKTVSVGTQVSGVIEKLYVDFNTQVKKGQLLAQLDETPLQAQLDQSKSSVDQAEAQVKYQKATYERYKVLISKKLIAQSDFDLAEYNYSNAVGNLKNAQSQYSKNKINLAYARISSPIDGIILNRAVDEGQTVAASFNTPTLFTIANDLTQMRVEAKVDEADIGKVLNGQRVEFNVDAFPLQKFSGSVTEIRLQPVITNNVVTYTVVVAAPNPENILKPGMTAIANFYVIERKDILVVPAKATRFTPDTIELAAYMPPKTKDGVQASEPQKPLLADSATKAKETGNQSIHTVWIKGPNGIHPQIVTIGDTDEINFEVINGLNEGDELITSVITIGAQTKKTNSPPSFLKPRGVEKRTSTTNTNQGPLPQ